MNEQDDDRAAKMIAAVEVRDLQANLRAQMESIIKQKDLSASLRLKVVRKLMIVEASITIEALKIEAGIPKPQTKE